MTKPDISFNAFHIKFLANSSIPNKTIFGPTVVNKDNVSQLLQGVINKYPITHDFSIQKVVLNLGEIPLQHYSIHFQRRLHLALVKLFTHLEKMPRNGALPMDDKEHSGAGEEHTSLLAQATSYLQANTLPSLAYSTVQNAALYKSLLQAVQTYIATKTGFHSQAAYKESMYVAMPQRLTPLRLAHLALSYLLTEREGCRWLCQHSLTLTQRDGWAAAIVAREIQATQVLQLIELLSVLPIIEAQTIAGRWIVPVWRHPDVTWAVRQQLGKAAVQQIDDYLASLLPASRFVTPVASATREAWQTPTSPGAPSQAQREMTSSDAAIVSGQSAKTPGAAITRPQFERRSPTRHSRRASDTPAAEGLPVSNAGMVLFWSLFIQWFTALGLMEDKQFISDDARWQAVAALDWLVWEQDELDAQRLVINQFLCGLPLSDPPTTLASLSPELRQTTQIWANAITQQLTSFEKLSLTDIRQLFLQRPGELFADTTPAVLNVKPEPFDILLSKWPWPLNLAYFPWFDAPLIIEWPGSQPAGTRL